MKANGILINKLLNDLKHGENRALSDLYDLTSKQLYVLCYGYMKNKVDSEDVLSETYLKVLKNISKFKGEKGFNWMFTIAINTCLNSLKLRTKNIACESQILENCSDKQDIKINDESGIIEISKDILKDNEFRIVILHAVNGFKFAEIASIFGGLESTIRWQYNNALKKVKKEFERRYENEN